MKTNISEFENYEKLNKFLDNPLIQKEIDLKQDYSKKCEWENILQMMLKEYIKVNKVKNLEIKWDLNANLNFDVTYSLLR